MLSILYAKPNFYQADFSFMSGINLKNKIPNKLKTISENLIDFLTQKHYNVSKIWFYMTAISDNYAKQPTELLTSPPQDSYSLGPVRDLILSGKIENAKKELSKLIAIVQKDHSLSQQAKDLSISSLLSKLRTECGGRSSPEFVKFVHCNHSKPLNQLFWEHCRQIGIADNPSIDYTKSYFYLKDFYFPQDIQSLKSETSPDFTCRKTVVIFIKVLNDGLGDFANSWSVIKALEHCAHRIECRVFSDPKHLEKVRNTFGDSIEEMQDWHPSFHIQWIDDAEARKHVNELANDNSRIVIAPATGYFYFNSSSFVDCIHEMSPPELDCSDIENEYTPTRLSLKLGFSPLSAGVMLPEKAHCSLETALDSSGCLLRIRNQIGNPHAPFSELLKTNDITLMYMKHKMTENRYLKFVKMYADMKKNPIHVIVPTNNPLKLQTIQGEPHPNVILHYCPLLKAKDFQAIVQQATAPSGITGNDSFMNALIGHTPFFCDGIASVKPIIKEFLEFCRGQNLTLHWATQSYLQHMERMVETDLDISDEDMRHEVSILHENMQAIRNDLAKIHQIVLKTANAATLLHNRLYERSGLA